MNNNDRTFYPTTLTNLPNWILWKLEIVEGRTTKVPYQARLYNKKAMTNNPETWCSFENALSRYNSSNGLYNGLGFVVTKESGIVFIDIDHCIDEDGEINEVASDILSALEECSYVEVSQSGKGLHLFTKGVIPKSFKNSKLGVEIYSDKRFCAMTFISYNDNDLGYNQDALSLVYDKYKLPDKTPKEKNDPITYDYVSDKTVDYIIDKLKKNSLTYQLMCGDIDNFQSHSEADFYLCTQIAFWCDRNPAMIDDVFRHSGLYREKWDREDYRTNTIKKACDGCRESISDFIIHKQMEKAQKYEEYLQRYYS